MGLLLLARGTQVVSSYVRRQFNHPVGVGVGGPKIQPDRNIGCTLCRSDRAGQGKGCTSLVARVLLSMANLEELSRSFFELTLGVARIWEGVSFASMVAKGRRTPVNRNSWPRRIQHA